LKRTLTSIAAAGLVLGTMVPAAFAASTANNAAKVVGTKAVVVNGKTIFNPYELTAVDSGNTTAYFGVYYFQQALKAAGYGATWDGNTHTLALTASGVDASKVTVAGGVGTGNTTVTLNGVTIKKFNTFSHVDPADGKTQTTYFPVYYINNILSALGAGGSWDATKGLTVTTPVATKLAITGAPSNSIAVGQQQAFGLTDNGQAVTSGVTWSVDKAGAVVDQNGNFIASAPGTYTVTASYEGQTATAQVVVYGQAAAVKLSVPSSLVANKYSTGTVTATVVDANGNAVTNFTGSATLHFDTHNNAFAFVPSTDTSPAYGDGSVTTLDQTIKFTNGVATFTVIAGQTPGVTDKIELQNLVDNNGVAVSGYQPASATITTVAQTPTSISVKPESNYVETNDGSGKVTFDVNVLDQNGQPMLGGTYSLTGAITGGGKFDADGTTSGETIVVSGGAKTQVVVDAPKGVNGTYTLTVTGNGLTTGSGSVTAAVAQTPAKLTTTVDSASSSSFVEGKGSIVIDFGTADANGVSTSTGLVAGHTYALYITDKNGNAFTPTVTIKGGSHDGSPATPTADGTGFVIPADATGVTIQDTSKQPDAGTYSVVLKDTTTTGALTAAPALSYSETADTVVGKIGFTSVNNILSGSGSTLSTTVTAQLEDANGNPISGNGDRITFSATPVSSNTGAAGFNSGSMSANPSFQVKADGTGKATVTFVAQNYGGDKWNVTAAADGQTSTPAEIDVVAHPAASYAFKLQDASSNSLVYATAGDTIQIAKVDGSAPQALLNSALDVNGNAATATNDNVTVTVQHASGLSGIPTSSGTVQSGKVAVSVNTSSDTATFTGALSDVSSYFATGTTVKAAKVGNVIFSIKDNSTGATGSASIAVQAGTAVAGTLVPTYQNATTLTKGTANAFTLELVDAGGNVVVAPSDVTVTLAWTGGQPATFEDSNHAPLASNQVTIKKGQSSANLYFVAPSTADSGKITAAITSPAYTFNSATITVQ
jgi:hypothetical protein